MSTYEKPAITDHGTLLDLTAGAGQVGSEDGVGKTIQAGVGDVAEVSIGVLP